MVSGELAKASGLLPEETNIKDAVIWAWQRFLASPDAAPLAPEEQIVANLRGWVAERWAVTIKDVNMESGVNNRETVGCFDEAAVYIPKSRLREAAGNTMPEGQIASILDRLGLLARTEKDRRIIRYVPKVGKMLAYALKREHFGRAQKDPPWTVHQGGRDD